MTEPSEIYVWSVKEELEYQQAALQFACAEFTATTEASWLSVAEAAAAMELEPWWERLESVGLWRGEGDNG